MICYQTLPTNSLKKCMKISMENLYVDIGAQRVNYIKVPLYCYNNVKAPITVPKKNIFLRKQHACKKKFDLNTAWFFKIFLLLFWHTIQPSAKLFRWQAIILLSSEPHAASQKVKSCKTMVKTARDLGGAMVTSYCLKQNSSGSKNYYII